MNTVADYLKSYTAQKEAWIRSLSSPFDRIVFSTSYLKHVSVYCYSHDQTLKNRQRFSLTFETYSFMEHVSFFYPEMHHSKDKSMCYYHLLEYTKNSILLL